MNSDVDGIVVRSHVARDLLQSAGLFRTDALVVWEYVSNGLQYVDAGVNATVRVMLDDRKKTVTIQDNGRGMDWEGLQNFFVMHGDNIDRKEGRAGRGRFGTGKSAAFGIADVLKIATVRNCRRSVVELRRSDIIRMTSGNAIPVRVLERERAEDSANGTVVEIGDVHLRSLDRPAIIRYIERQILRWPNATVFVNNHECEFAEPPVAQEMTIQPDEKTRKVIGDVELKLRVAKIPLDADLRGVAVYCNGIWHETTLAGSCSREMSQYIFGEIDVARLESDDSPISPFDMSRSMKLNPNNEIVRAIYAFIGENIESLRRELVAGEQKRKQDEEAKRLAEHAGEIAECINDDFDEFARKLRRARARSGSGPDYSDIPGNAEEGEGALVFGTSVPADIVSPSGEEGTSNSGGSRGRMPPPRELLPIVEAGNEESEARGRPSTPEGQRRAKRGGFHVEFKNMGEKSDRAKYVGEERTIYINLDHPQLVAAKGDGGIQEVAFRRLAYEVAFTEYSIALVHEMAAHSYIIDTSDALWEVRDTLNRMARKTALLYSA